MLLALAAILGAAVLFTDAVEIAGERPNLGAGAVGSVLAAVEKALQETMIALVAIPGALLVGTGGAGGAAAGEIGIGVILGAPFLLRPAPLRASYLLGAGSLYVVFVVTTVVYLLA